MQPVSDTFTPLVPLPFDKEALFESSFGQIRQSLRELKHEIFQLERTKAQSVVHIQQYAHDINAIKNLTEKIRAAIAFDFLGKGPTVPPPNPTPPHATPGHIAQPVFQKFESNQIDWHFIQNGKNNFPPQSNKVTLRYALLTHAIICSVKFSPDGKQFAFTDQNFLYLHNTVDGSIAQCWDIQAFKGSPGHHACTLAFSPVYRYLALGAPDYSILIFDLQDNQLHYILKSHTQDVSSLNFFHDNTRLISGGFDAQIIFWDLQSQKALERLQYGAQQTISRLVLSSDDVLLAAGFYDGNVGIFNLTGLMQQNKVFRAHSEPLLGIAISHTGYLIATTSQDLQIKVWMGSKADVQTCAVLSGHTDFVLAACFSTDDALLISGSKDESIRGWDVKTGENIWTIQTRMNTVFDIDHSMTQRTFATCNGDGFICIWDYKP